MLELNTTIKLPILDTLGIHYAVLIEPNSKAKVLHLAQGDVDVDLGTKEELRELFNQINALNLAQTWTEVREKIMDFVLPDAPMSHNFELCTCGKPLQHGYITDASGDPRCALPIYSLFDGIIQTHVLFESGKLDEHTAIRLLKKIVEQDMPNNETEEQARYEALPEDVREKFEREVLGNSPLPVLIISVRK